MTGGPGYAAWTVGLKVRKNAKPDTSEGLAYIFVKMLAGPLLSEIKFREPCYMVTENNIAVSVCFSARNSDKAAEAGVETLEDYRGKGYAIRVASSWAQAIRQSQRIPLYSTSWDNYSSQSVAKRLQLHFYGTDISIY